MLSLLRQLQERQIRISATDGKLVLQAPEGSLDDELRASLRSHKAALIAYLERLSGAASDTDLLPRPRAPGADAPLSYAQQRLWFLDQFEPGSTLYNLPLALRLNGALDIGALQAAINEVVRRHEVLRTTFGMRDSVPFQRVAPALTISLPVTDLSHLEADEQQAYVREQAEAEAHVHFDLQSGPLLRARLLRLGEARHILLFTMHHIVSDGWSSGVLLQEIGGLYSAFRDGLPSPLAPLSLQYADFACWQHSAQMQARLERQLDYWCSALASVPTLLNLPTDRPRPAVQSHRGARHVFTLSQTDSARANALAKQARVSLFMLLNSVFNVLLWRYSGSTDICVGTAIANRNRAETEALIGFFVNTLVLRTHIDADAGFDSLLEQVRGVTLQAYEHQDAPFEQVVDAVKPERNLSHAPLFQVMLVMQNAPAGIAQLPELTLELIEPQHDAAKFDLTLELTENDGQLSGAFEYSTDLFEAGTVARMARHFESLLASACAQPSVRLADMPLLDESEKQQLAGFNATRVAYPGALMVHELFEQQAAALPDAPALRTEAGELSYAQLNRRANQVAHYLRDLGVGTDDRVAVCMERSADMVVALLGIMKAGAAYVPLDPQLPAQRLAYMLADSAPRALIMQAGGGAGLALPADMPALVLDLDDPHGVFAQQPQHDRRAPGLAPDNLAYVIYTSGSTGMPKGVLNTHAGLLNRLQWMQQAFALDASDSVLQKTPFGFDVSVWEFFWPLMVGARLVLARPQGHRDNAYLSELVAREAITTMHFVPPMLAQFLDHPEASRCTGLRRVICSGEALPGLTAERFFDVLPHCELHNLYGPTEAAIDVTWFACSAAHGAATVPIGRPIANTEIHILDPHGQPVPIGVSGEIHIGGVQVARGYLNRAALSAERFIDNPFNPGGRLYKTGDLGRWREDGNVVYLGRNDFQVKLRGFRIELGEIEAQLAACAGVREAVVIAREEAGAATRLVAYLTAQGGAELSAAQLRAALAQGLPEYMLPSAFVILAQLPLTANGKLDRAALPAPDQGALAVRGYQAPQGATEQALATIWGELLGIDRVGRDDNFFELGGHSLMVVTLLERLRRHGLGAGLRAIFANPALAAMAAVLTDERAVPEPALPPNLIPAGCKTITPAMLPLLQLEQEHIDRIVASVPQGAANIEDIYPLASLQEGILFHSLLETTGDAYLLRTVLAFDSRQRLDYFLSALQTVIDRHTALRSAVRWSGLPQPVQVVYRQAVLPVFEMSVAAGADARAELMQATDPRTVRLDLQQAPLFAAHVAAEPDQRTHYLALLNHHIVSDHVTLELVIEEISALLDRDAHALRIPVPYRNFIAHGMALSSAAHETYFRAQLGDIDAPTAPFELFDIGQGADTIQETHVPLDAALAERIRAGAKQCGVTPAVLFHVAWAQVLGQCTGRDDVVFGTVLSGRLQGGEGAARAVGMCMNTLPIRLSLHQFSVLEAVTHTYQQLSELLVHEQASLTLAQRCSGVAPPAPLFTTLLNYRHSRSLDGRDGAGLGLDGVTLLHGEERTNYPISVAVNDLGEGFSLTAQCSGIAPDRIAAYLATTVERLVTALGEEPAMAVNRIDVLPPAERQTMLHDWNRQARAYPPQDTLGVLFERQVARSPERIVAVCGGEELSYAQLNARANRLAHFLIAQGVGADQLVGVCVERSLDMLTALLAVVKAGGAYVPIDPAYPQERVAYMVEHAQPLLLLTQQSLLDRLPAVCPRVCIDTLAPAPGTGAEQNPPHRCAPQQLAYVIYTSGSTGKPKGVAVSHLALGNFLHSMQEQPGIAADDVLLSVTSLSFDIAALELFLPLVCGARTVIASRAEATDPAQLVELMQACRATMMQATPATWRMVCSQSWPVLARPLKLLCGGEALPPDLARQLLVHVPAIWNMYGPTETTIWSTVRRITAQDVAITLGAPIGNTRIYLLDARRQPVPLGVAGQLYIGGAGLARGYLHNQALTDEKFVADPFAGTPDARMYNTGDLARYRPDGELEYLGRLDQQVKLNGFRIELGEIEAVLQTHAAVAQAVVTARATEAGDARLVAYVVPEAGQGGRVPGMSLFYFGADSYDPADKYRLYVASAKFADEHGFEAVWTPERHFHTTGSLYPNPAVLNAALATVTEHVQLRAGSVVLPLHDPIRVAEEWSVVDNLSHGRCGLAIASGWHPRDFVLKPEHYAERKQHMLDGINALRTLWSGASLTRKDGAGNDTPVSLFPQPVQAELPMWITAAGNPDTFVLAGKLGVNVLTHLLGQTIEEVAVNIALYRQARREHGHDPDTGKVSLMVHTYVGDDLAHTLGSARAPFLAYMRSHLGLLASMIKSLNLPAGDGSPEELERMADFAFERYSRTASLIGTPESCLPLLQRFTQIGVDEVACLVDWIDSEAALAALPALHRLQTMARSNPRVDVGALRAYLSEHLPDFMLPSSFVMLDAMPLTPNGKIDRKALPAPQLVLASRGYEAPRGQVETAIGQLWQELLGQVQIGRHDNFFELGGHSLLALRFISRLRVLLEREIELRVLIMNPTLAQFCAAIDVRSLAARPSCLSQIRDGSGLPLFFLHTGAGDSFYANDLAPWLAPDVPLYSLTAQGYFDDRAPMRTIEEMGRHYLDLIRGVQPHGPYRMAGWSTGGLLAYDIAQRLMAEGETVQLVGLIDTSAATRPYQIDERFSYGQEQLPGHYDLIATILHELPAGLSDRSVAEWAALAAQGNVDAMLSLGQRHGLIPEEFDAPVLRRLLAVRNAMDNACYRYTVPPCGAAPVIMFKGIDGFDGDTALGWRPHVGERLELVELPGDHMTIVEQPHRQALGAALTAALLHTSLDRAPQKDAA